MDYTDKERQVLSLMQRTDFKNLSKNDIISFASKLENCDQKLQRKCLHNFQNLLDT